MIIFYHLRVWPETIVSEMWSLCWWWCLNKPASSLFFREMYSLLNVFQSLNSLWHPSSFDVKEDTLNLRGWLCPPSPLPEKKFISQLSHSFFCRLQTVALFILMMSCKFLQVIQHFWFKSQLLASFTTFPSFNRYSTRFQSSSTRVHLSYWTSSPEIPHSTTVNWDELDIF